MKTKLFLALLLAAVVTWGCGSSDTTSVPAATPAAQKTGTVSFSIKFPTAAATKAFIDSSTNKVVITGYGYMGGWQMSTPLELTPASPTGSVEVPEGQLCFYADAQDGAGMTFDHASTCGEVVAGINNKATLTFLGADWEFVNASNVATPMTLASATHGNVSLAGFRLSQYQYAGPMKTAIDYTKPSGWSEYGLQYFSGTTASATKFAPLRFGGSESQFLPGATASSNYNAFWGGEINLDTPANSPVGEGLESGWSVGERVAFILDEVSGSGTTETITTSTGQNALPTLQTYADSQVVDGTTMTGHFLEMTYGPTPTSVVKTENTDCNVFWRQNEAMPARAAAIKAALASRAGKAAPNDATTLDAGTISVSYDDCTADYAAAQIDGDGDGDMANDWLSYDANYNGRYDAADGDAYADYNVDGNFDFTYYPGTIYTNTETFSNVIVREFRAKAKQKGTSFALAPATISAHVGSYLQYRTHEDINNPNRYVGWMHYTDNGQPIDASDIAGVQLFDPEGVQIEPIKPPQFISANFLVAGWNGISFNTATASGYTGYFLDLGATTTTLPVGNYTFKTELATGQIFNTIRTVGAKVELPVVPSTLMSNTWNADGSLTLNWTEPAGSFGNYRIILRKMLATGSTEIFYASASPGTTSVTIPAALLNQIMTNAGITDPATVQLGWEVQTRSFDANNFEIARGRSDIILLSAPTTIAAGNSFIQYRTHENTASDRYVAWIEYKDSGVPVNQISLADSKLIDPDNNVLPVTPTFLQANYLQATWSAATSSFGTATSSAYSSYFFELGTADLALGNYTFRTTLAEGQVLLTKRTVDSKVALPVVSSSSMVATWNATKTNLSLSWAAPATTDTFTAYRVVLRNILATGGTPEIFYGVVPNGTTSVTIPEALLNEIYTNAGVDASASLAWEVQTRRFDAIDPKYEVSRGRSAIVSLDGTTGNITLQ